MIVIHQSAMGSNFDTNATIALVKAREENATVVFEFNGRVLIVDHAMALSDVLRQFTRQDEIAELKKTVADRDTVLGTIERMIEGGIMPDGWSVKSGPAKLVHETVLEYRKQIRELEAASNRQSFTIDELLRRLFGTCRSKDRGK